jgi:hypothetical protein
MGFLNVFLWCCAFLFYGVDSCLRCVLVLDWIGLVWGTDGMARLGLRIRLEWEGFWFGDRYG